jgi:hypothetical protein
LPKQPLHALIIDKLIIDRVNAMVPDNEPVKREAFIPHFRQDLIEMCVAEGKFSEQDAKRFRDLCDLLAAYHHFRMHAEIEEIKQLYAPFNPDLDLRLSNDAQKRTPSAAKDVVRIFEKIARRANCYEVSEAEIRASFAAETLIKLRTKVHLNDFQHVRCFASGDTFKTARVKKLFGTREQRVGVYERVLLLLHYQEQEYFEAKKKRTWGGEGTTTLGAFQPGCIYVYLYKDVPKYDLELLFPNVEVGMTLKDKLLFGIPALGGLVGVLFKALPQILLIVGVIVFLVAGPVHSAKLGVREESVRDFMPVLTALMGLVIAFGGLAFKQWSNYRKKRIEFLKDVSEQLFFRNLASNQSVFHQVFDRAEAEDNKEMLLAMYHLMQCGEAGATSAELDAMIENWMKAKFGTVIDFDCDDAIGKLKALRGPGRDGTETALVQTDAEGRHRAASLTDALHLLDHLWDQAFRFA